MQNFFLTPNVLAAFSNLSPKRYNALQEYVKKKIQTVAATRWNFTSRSTNTVQQNWSELINFFQTCVDHSNEWDSDTVIKARWFFSFLKKKMTISYFLNYAQFFLRILMYCMTSFKRNALIYYITPRKLKIWVHAVDNIRYHNEQKYVCTTQYQPQQFRCFLNGNMRL